MSCTKIVSLNIMLGDSKPITKYFAHAVCYCITLPFVIIIGNNIIIRVEEYLRHLFYLQPFL